MKSAILRFHTSNSLPHLVYAVFPCRGIPRTKSALKNVAQNVDAADNE